MRKNTLTFLSILACAALATTGGLLTVKSAYSEYYDPNGPAMTSGSLAELREIGMAEKAAGTPYSDQNGTPVYVNPSTGQYSYSYFNGATKIEGYDYSAMDGSSGGTNTAPSSGSGQKGNAPQRQAAQKQYPHDFDYISDEAQEALVYFTKDGKPDSAYINLPASSSQNSISGTVLRRSLDGKEDLTVNFIEDSEDDVITKTVSWRFTEMDVDDDYTLDLSTEFEKDESLGYEDTYRLSFADGKTVSENVLEVSIKDSEFSEGDTYRLYTMDADGTFHEITTSTADSDNTITFPVTDLVSYTVSKTDLVAAQEEAKREEEKAKEAEAEKEAQETQQEEPEKVQEAGDEAEEQISEPISEESELQTIKKGIPVLFVCAGAAAIIIAIILDIIAKNKNRP